MIGKIFSDIQIKSTLAMYVLQSLQEHTSSFHDLIFFFFFEIRLKNYSTWFFLVQAPRFLSIDV